MQSNPFKDAAHIYWQAGYKPMPMVDGLTKTPPPVGATGYSGTVTESKIEGWLANTNERNIALRLEGVIAIDVDDGYQGKLGGTQLRELEAEFGELPPTYSSTSRGDDSPSRQYFFRVPEGVKLQSKPKSNIEVCQLTHRYSIVYPSIHPDTGLVYHWYDPNGTRMTGIPRKEALPLLPESWLDGLRVETKSYDESVDIVEADEFFSNLADHRVCPKVDFVIEDLVELGAEDHIGHDSMIKFQYRLFSLGRDGHAGVPTAMSQLRELFFDYVACDPHRDGVSEWKRAFAQGVTRVQQDVDRDDLWDVIGTCGCQDNHAPGPSEGTIVEGEVVSSRVVHDLPPAPDSGVLADFMAYIEAVENSEGFLPPTQEGAALRFVREYGREICYVPGIGWGVYDGKRWALGGERADSYANVRMRTIKSIVQEEMQTIKSQLRQAEKQHEEKKDTPQKDEAALVVTLAKARLGSWHKFLTDLQSTGFIGGCLEAGRVLLTKDHEEFDQDPLTLNVTNGTLVFSYIEDEGLTAELSPHSPDDYLSHLSPVEWDERLWLDIRTFGENSIKDTFFGKTLARAQPDEVDREFLAKLSGLTMIGDNRKELMSISYGTGANLKSTFIVDALKKTLGPDLARDIDPSTVTKTVNKSAGGPRSDLVKLRGLRMVHVPEVTDELDANLLKRMTGGEEMTARAPYAKSDITFQPKFTLWLSTNDIPESKDLSDGFWRRTAVIPWTQKVPERERMDKDEVSDLMESDRSVILAWMVWGLGLFLSDGVKFPESVASFTADTRADQDWRLDVVEALLSEEEGAFVTQKDLWEAAHTAHNPLQMGKNTYLSAMDSTLGMRDRRRVEGKLERGWVGWRMKPKRFF